MAYSHLHKTLLIAGLFLTAGTTPARQTPSQPKPSDILSIDCNCPQVYLGLGDISLRECAAWTANKQAAKESVVASSLPANSGSTSEASLFGQLVDQGGKLVHNTVTGAVDTVKQKSGLIVLAPGVVPMLGVANSPNFSYIPGVSEAVSIIKRNDNSVDEFLRKAADDAVHITQSADAEAFKRVTQIAGKDVALYGMAWHYTNANVKKKFDDAVDAGKATERFVFRQTHDVGVDLGAVPEQMRKGKTLDAMWSISTTIVRNGEKNAFMATQESDVINQAASTAAATYGGPAGAAAYAAWQTYRTTGDANKAWQVGIKVGALNAAMSHVNNMPAHTVDQIAQKAIMAGTAGGIAVAAQGGTQQDIIDSFLKAGGNVIIQDGSKYASDKLPVSQDTKEVATCITARDIKCLANTRYAVQMKDNVVTYVIGPDGKRKIDSLTSNDRAGGWIGEDQYKPANQELKVKTSISNLPNSNDIPVMNNRFVLTTTLGAPNRDPKAPAVTLTAVGNAPIFTWVAYYPDNGERLTCPQVDVRSPHSVDNKPRSKSIVSRTPPRSVSPRSTQLAPITAYMCSTGARHDSIVILKLQHGCKVEHYRTNNKTEVIWNTRLGRDSCDVHANIFAKHMREMGFTCQAP